MHVFLYNLSPLTRTFLAEQGPKKRWGPITGFDILSKTGALGSCRARFAGFR